MRLAIALACALSLPACFNPDQPACTFRCDSAIGNGRRCPESYSCGADNYCHLNGNTDVCPYAVDSAVIVDMTAASPDLTPAADLTTVDASPGN